MYAIYGNMDPINIPPMLAYIPAREHQIEETTIVHRKIPWLHVDFPGRNNPA